MSGLVKNRCHESAWPVVIVPTLRPRFKPVLECFYRGFQTGAREGRRGNASGDAPLLQVRKGGLRVQFKQREAEMLKYFGNIKLRLPLFFLLLIFLPSIRIAVADSGRFELKKTDSGAAPKEICWTAGVARPGARKIEREFSYESEYDDYIDKFEYKGPGSDEVTEMCWDTGVALPGADMIAGELSYSSDYNTYIGGRKAAVLAAGRIIYYVASMEKKNVNNIVGDYDIGSLDIGGDTNYGIYGSYLVMDSWAYQSVSGHNRRMFLFKYGKDTVELLDVLHGSMDFSSVGEDRIYETKEGMYWMEIKDFDNDGNPEIKAINAPRRAFVFFLEIKDDRLRVDFNPALYEPLFKAQKLKNRSRKKKNNAYYIYGFFAGALTLDNIKAAIRKNGEINKGQYNYVVAIIEGRDTWDREYHERDKTQPTLLRYEIQGR